MERFEFCRTGIRDGRLPLGVGSFDKVGMLDARLIPFPFLCGAGLADPEVGCVPLAFNAEPTESLAGLEGVDVITLRVGIRV